MLLHSSAANAVKGNGGQGLRGKVASFGCVSQW